MQSDYRGPSQEFPARYGEDRGGQGMGIRLDGIAFTGAEITPDYDSLLRLGVRSSLTLHVKIGDFQSVQKTKKKYFYMFWDIIRL